MTTTTSSDQHPQELSAKAVFLGDECIREPMHLFHLIEKGIPVKNAARALTALGLISNEQIVAKVLGMSSNTLRRAARDSQKVLSGYQSTCVWYFLDVLARAEEIIGPHQIAQRWITAPALGLGGYAPIDLLSNPFGYEIVSDFLTRLEYGVYQ
jgi:putative toxin-antitoxin system antitoxin component (TIGR02293 family)